MRNVAALGALTKVLGIPWENFEEIIKSTVRKGIETNLLIARASFDSIKREYMKIESTLLEMLKRHLSGHIMP